MPSTPVPPVTRLTSQTGIAARDILNAWAFVIDAHSTYIAGLTDSILGIGAGEDSSSLASSITGISQTVTALLSLVNDSALGSPMRPGEAPELFGPSIADGAPTSTERYTSTNTDRGAGGDAVLVRGDGLVAHRKLFTAEPGRKYQIRYVVERTTETLDPAEDAISCRLAAYNGNRNLISSVTVSDVEDLLVGGGRREVTALVSLDPGLGVSVVLPTNTVRVRPYVQIFGATQATSVFTMEWTDVTDAGVVSPDVSAVSSRVGALESLTLGARTAALEAGASAPIRYSFKTLADVHTATIGAGINVIEVMGYSVYGRGRAIYVRADTMPAHELRVQSADGAWWGIDGQVTSAMCGCVGDGVADDTAAVNLALRFSHVSGRSVTLLAGTHLCGRLYMDKKASLVGENKITSILKCKNGVNATFIGPLVDYQDDATLENMTIDGNRANNTSGNALVMVGSAFRLSNLLIINAAWNGLTTYPGAVEDGYRTPGVEARMTNIYIADCGRTGLEHRGPPDSYMEQIHVRTCSMSADDTYYMIDLVVGCRAVDLHTYDLSTDSPIAGAGCIVRSTGVNCTNSHFEGGYTALHLLPEAYGNIFEGCYYYAPRSSNAVYVQSSSNVITGNFGNGAALPFRPDYVGCSIGPNAAFNFIEGVDTGCNNGSVNFGSGTAGGNVVRMRGFHTDTASVGYSGTPHTTDDVNIYIGGITTRAKLVKPMDTPP